jgi:hypothetical protein
MQMTTARFGRDQNRVGTPGGRRGDLCLEQGRVLVAERPRELMLEEHSGGGLWLGQELLLLTLLAMLCDVG